MSILEPTKDWIKRRLVKRALASIDLSTLSDNPATMPLRRDGLDPVPELGQMRADTPVNKFYRLMGRDVWLVTGYHEARAVLADRTSFKNDIRPLVGRTNATGAEAIGGLGSTDAPEHTRLRKLLTPEFTMRRLARLQPRIAEIVDEQLDVVAAAGPGVDLVETFAFPIPFRVICELLGLPEEDRARFQENGHARFDASGGLNGLFGAMSDSREFLIDAVAKQRHDPGDGLIGSILREHGDELSDVELGGLADGVFLGGFETSASMLTLGTLTLLQHPESFAKLREGDESVTLIIDELLRYLSVVQVAFPRIAREDMDLCGTPIKEGDIVLCSLSGANRDPVFGENSEHFDPKPHQPPHLAFGHGLHRCVGSELGRMELKAALSGLSHRFPDIAIAVDADELAFHDLSIVHGVQKLPVNCG